MKVPTSTRSCMIVGSVVTLLLIACDGSGPDPSTPKNSATCGVRAFASDSCEASVSRVCCAQKVECAEDGICNRLAACLVGCKGKKGEDCKESCLNADPPS